MDQASIQIPTVEGHIKLKYSINEADAKNAGTKVGEKFNEGFNDEVNNNRLYGDSPDAAHFDSQFRYYKEMKKVLADAEYSYISLQKAIMKRDLDAQDKYREEYEKKRRLYQGVDGYYEHFQKDVRGLSKDAIEWVSQTFDTQIMKSGRIDAVVSELKQQFIEKGKQLAQNVIGKNNKLGGVLEGEKIESLQKNVDWLERSPDIQELNRNYIELEERIASLNDELTIYANKQKEAAKAEKEAAKATSQASKEAVSKAKNKKAGVQSTSSADGGNKKSKRKKKGGGGSGSGSGGGDDGGYFMGGGSSDDSNWSHVNEQRRTFNAMKRVYNTAERSYISMQRAIFGDDKKGQDFFAGLQRSNVASYNNYYRHFLNDDTGLTEDQKDWVSRTYTEQREISERVNKAMSGLRISAIKKGTSLIDDVTKKNAESGGNVVGVKTVEQLKKALEGIKGADKVEEIVAAFKKLKTVADSAKEAIKKYNEEADDKEKLAASVEKNTPKADETVNKIDKEIGRKERAGEESSQELQDAKAASETYKSVRDTGTLKEKEAAINALKEAWVKYKIAEDAALENKAEKDHITAMSEGLDEAQKSLEKIQNMGGGENNWSQNLKDQYKAAADAARQLQDALSGNEVDVTAATNAYNKMGEALATLSQNFSTVDKAATRMGFSLVENAKQLLGIASPVAIFQGAKSIVKNMANEVTTVNTAMAELRKVTDETEVAYSRFLSNATSTAKEIGSTVSDLINTSSEFARMGYSMSESADLGKTATIFSNVGDFSSVNDASDTLISTMKGFQLSTDMADDIGDKLNAVANKYAVTAADIGEGLQNAASSLNISGNSLDESIAMLTTITEITQDASAAGNALKILSLRLRGASAELENMGESTDGMADSTSKLREQIKALTGFDIMEDDNTFKSTYDQMLGIAKVWDQMSDVSQSALLELIAGKTRSNQVAALLTNMKQASEILEVSQKSEGSMMEEHERWLDSIEAKQQQLTASFQELSQTVLGSELVAGTYDAGSGLLGLLNNLLSNTGTLAPLLGVLGTMGFSGLTGGNPLAMLFTKGLGDTDKKYIEEFNKIVESMGTANALDEVRKMADDAGDSISSLGNAMMVSSNGMKVMTTGVDGLKSRLKGTGSIVSGFAKTLAANLATTLAVAAAVKLLELAYNTIDRSVNSAKYAEEDWQEKKSELEELQNEKDEVTAELDDVGKQITELQDKLRTKGLTFVEQEELAKLERTSAELELQNKILAEQVKLKKQAVDEAESATYYTKYGANTSNLYDTYRGQYKRTPTGRRVRVAVSQEKRDYQSAQSYFATVKDYEQIYGGNIEGYFQAKNTLEANEPDENATEDELKKYSDAVSNMQYTTIKMFDTLEGLWGAYEYYNEKGLTNNDVYDNVLSYLDMFKNDEYFAPFFKEMASNYIAEQYKSEFDKLTEGIQKGTITEANIQTSISSGMAALITELFGDIGTWAENILNTYTPETSAAKATSGFTTTSLTSRLTEAGEHASLRDNIIAGEPVSTEDYEKLIEYGDEYAACVENINGTLQVNKQRLDEVVASEYAQLNKDIATGLQEEKNALAENIAELAEYTAQLQDTNQDQDDIIRHINTLTDEIDKNKEAIETYDILAAQIEYATSAYKKWVDAHDGKESGAQYDESFNALEDLREGYESGRVGTNEYKAAQEYLLGADGEYNERTAKVLSRYITEDRTGLDNFMNDLLSKGIINQSGEINGSQNAASIAKQMGISEELVKAMFMKANEYIAEESQKYQIGNTGYGASDYLKQYQQAEQNYNAAYQAWRDNQNDATYKALLEAAQAYNDISKEVGFGEVNVKDQETANRVASVAQTLVDALNNLANVITEQNKNETGGEGDNTGEKAGSDSNGGENKSGKESGTSGSGGKPYDNGEQLTLWGKTDAHGVSATGDMNLWSTNKQGTIVEGQGTSTLSLTRMSFADKLADFIGGLFGGKTEPANEEENGDTTSEGTQIDTAEIAAGNVSINAQGSNGINVTGTPNGNTNTAGQGSANNGGVGNGASVMPKSQNILTENGITYTPNLADAGRTAPVPLGESLDSRKQFLVQDTDRAMSDWSVTDPEQAAAVAAREKEAATGGVSTDTFVDMDEIAGKVATDTAVDIGEIASNVAAKQLEGVGIPKDENFTVADAISIASKQAGGDILELGEIAAQAAALKESADRVLTDYNENGKVPEYAKAAWDKIPESVKTYDGKMDWSTFKQNFVDYLDGQMLSVPVDADTTAAQQKISEITKTETKTVNVKIVGGEVEGYASGTNNALGGISLVDEEGAELIQRANGTYEVGTNSGPRLTELGKGDVVYTADETKGIFKRLAAWAGKRFVNGHNLTTNMMLEGDSGLTGKSPVSNGWWQFEKSSSGKSSSKKIDFDKLIDWIPTLLENLKRKTNDYIRMASKAIGYMLKNANIDSAIDSVKNELDYTEQAYNRYLQQADAVAKQTGLTQDIVDLIQQGAIDITQYSDKVKENIEEYQKWWDKAVDLTDTMDDLNDQLEELALQKLDNITTYFTDIDDLIDANISAMQDAISVKQAYGEELKENDYKPMIEYAEQAVANLTKYQDTLQKEFDALVDAGDIQVGSDAWYEYSTNIRKVSSEIANAKVQVSELNDELGNIAMTNLQTAYEYLQRIQSGIEGVGSLNDAQNVARSVKQYRTLISNGMEQIENLEMQNEELKKQMEGLDILSEKYIELNAQLNDNQEAIMSIKQSQEQWNDAIIDLKIDELQKQNDEFKQRLEIMDAIQEVEDAQQRRVSIYREGQGFVYEADQRELKDAQDNLEEAVNDLIINQLEATKELSNIYDSVGNQLVEVKDMLSGIDFTKYYSSVSAGVEDSTLLKDALSAIDAASIISNLATKDVSIDLSGMTLNNVNSVEELVDAIINQLPGYILQELHSKS